MNSSPRAYLDFNASAPLRPEARAAMLAALALSGNASSIHAEGRAARGVIEAARRDVANLVGAAPAAVVFTSGGTEAANMALARGPNYGGLILGAGEHLCVLQGHRFGADQTRIAPLGADGRLDLAALQDLLRQSVGGAPLVAVQGANNETGVIQPVTETAAMVHEAGGRLVCDAVQLAGRAPIALAELGADMIFISAHKLGGPKGVGALIAARAENLPPAFHRGGGQERGARAGTENVAGIAGFAAAALAARAQMAQESARLCALRDAAERLVLNIAPDAVIFGAMAARVPNTLNFAIPGVAAQILLIALDLAGVAVSSGSACSSGKVGASHVLAAMGVAPELSQGAIRVSLGWSSNANEIEMFGVALGSALAALKRRRGFNIEP